MSEPRKELGILKTDFGQSQGGTWEIQALTSIVLRPQVGKEDGGFFEIRDDIVVRQPNLLRTTTSVLGQSIVPVVTQVSGELLLRCLGTGFFISCSGLLITAAHVITDPITRQYGRVRELDDQTWHLGDLRLGVMIPLNPILQGQGYIYRAIEWAAFLARRTENPLPIAGVDLKLNSDTAICKVSPIADGVPHQPLAIVQSGLVGTGMGVGKRAAAIGYGEMKDIALKQESDRVVSGDFSFRLHASSGVLLERFPDNLTEKHVPAPGPCFSAALRLPGGMSGSPIFDDEGVYVHGVVSKGWIDENGVAPLGYGSMIAPSLGLPIRPLGNKTLLELHDSVEHGFPKLKGPGL
jgi:Trypsin-like peptidase domain